MDADWLAGYESRIADLRSKSEELQTRLAEDKVTVSSQDESVTITLGLTGALEDLRLGHRACDLGPARLTALIMQTLGTARAKAAHRAAEAFSPLGAGTEAMRLLNLHLPQDDDTDQQPTQPPAQQAPQSPAATPPTRKPTGRRPPTDDDDDDVELW